MAPVVIDSDGISTMFSIALATEACDHQARVVELLAVCYLLPVAKQAALLPIVAH